MAYKGKYTGAEVDALLDKVNEGGTGIDPSGVYPNLIAGDLIGRGEGIPAEFTFRASGGKSIKDGRAYIKRIKGNSIVVDGNVIHMNTESIKSVGDNAWDEEWEVGYLTSTGATAGYVQNYIRAKNYIPVIPGENYYAHIPSNVSDAQLYICDEKYNFIEHKSGWANKTFIVPEGAKYIRFYMNYGGEVYNHDIMITLVHSGWKQDTDAGYQPYWQDILPLPIISKYFPDGMKKAGKAYDEIRYNNALNRWEAVTRVASIDLGSLTWLDYDINGYAGFISRNLQLGAPGLNVDNGAICALYTDAGTDWYFNGKDKVISVNNGYTIGASDLDAIVVRDTAYADAASFKEAMEGVMLYYELANPIVTEIEEVFNSDYQVADFGTEEAISSIPSAPFSADITYQFNAVDMIREHELEIVELQSIIATMQADLANIINNNQ